MSRVPRSAFTPPEKGVGVGFFPDQALHRAGIGPEGGDSSVEGLLSAAEDEDESAILDEALCRGAADAGRATRDDCNLAVKLSHNVSCRGVGAASAPEDPDIGPPALSV